MCGLFKNEQASDKNNGSLDPDTLATLNHVYFDSDNATIDEILFVAKELNRWFEENVINGDVCAKAYRTSLTDLVKLYWRLYSDILSYSPRIDKQDGE